LKRLAIVELGVKPWEFGQLTLGELWLMVRAKQKRDESERERIAWLISWVTAPHVKKPISVDQILGRKSKNQMKTKAERKEELEWLKKRFAKQLEKR